MKNNEIMPGDRKLVFDHRLYKNDILTPLSITMKPALIISRYGEQYFSLGHKRRYSDLVDVIFDHRPNEVSKAHFTSGLMDIK